MAGKTILVFLTPRISQNTINVVFISLFAANREFSVVYIHVFNVTFEYFTVDNLCVHKHVYVIKKQKYTHTHTYLEKKGCSLLAGNQSSPTSMCIFFRISRFFFCSFWFQCVSWLVQAH